jgi:hypothetical protein
LIGLERDDFLMNKSQHTVQKRLAQLVKEMPTLGMKQYPCTLKSISDLPGELQSPFITSLLTDQTIQTIIVIPPQIQNMRYYVPRQALLFTNTGVVHVIASIWPDQEPQGTLIKGSSILYMKVRLLLLYGLLEVEAQESDSPVRIGVEFNTVAWEMLSQPLHRLLQTSQPNASAHADIRENAPAAQKAMDALSFKFNNGMRIYAFLPGEGLEELVFQPGVNKIWELWPFQFRKPITADTVVSLTSNFVVTLQEELGKWYGWILTFFPRNKIIGMQSRPEGLYDELVVQLGQPENCTEYRIPLGRDAIETWMARWVQQGVRWQNLPIDTADRHKMENSSG